jgi:hypothetical protein
MCKDDLYETIKAVKVFSEGWRTKLHIKLNRYGGNLIDSLYGESLQRKYAK